MVIQDHLEMLDQEEMLAKTDHKDHLVLQDLLAVMAKEDYQVQQDQEVSK